MKRRTLVCASAFAFLFGFASFGTSFAQEGQGPAEMTLKTEQAKKPAVFPHRKHQEMYKCGECHHGEADGKQIPYKEGMEIKPCPACHNESMKNKNLDSFMKAAHARCRGCHQKVAAEGKKAPTKCSGCHPPQ